MTVAPEIAPSVDATTGSRARPACAAALNRPGTTSPTDLDDTAEAYAAMDERRAIKALVKVSELA